MIKAGDFIYNKFLEKYFIVIESSVYWDRENCHSLVKPKSKSKCLYRKWRYKVQPTDKEWEYEKCPSPWDTETWSWRVSNRHDKTFKQIPTRKHSEDMSEIWPGTFEAKGFRLLNKSERRVLKVLFG